MSASKTEHALVAGFPSQLARMVVTRLLAKDDSCTVTAIARSNDIPLFDNYLASFPSEQRARVDVLQGDSSAMDMGLSGGELLRIARKTTRIFALASFQAGTSSSRASKLIVDSTIEAIEVANTCPNLRLLTLLSSASVAGVRDGLALESSLLSRAPVGLPAKSSRMRAERIARRAMRKLPIAVVRPSVVVGSSVTGEIDSFSGPYPLFLLMLTERPPKLSAISLQRQRPLNLVPIDFVARAIAHIGTVDQSASKTFHVVDPAPLPAKRVFELYRRTASRVSSQGHVPSHVIKYLLKSPGYRSLLDGPVKFLDSLAGPEQYETLNTEKALRGTGIVCPPIEAYMDKLVSFVYEKARHQATETWNKRADEYDPLAE